VNFFSNTIFRGHAGAKNKVKSKAMGQLRKKQMARKNFKSRKKQQISVCKIKLIALLPLEICRLVAVFG